MDTILHSTQKENPKINTRDTGYFSYEEIAATLGISRQKVREIERMALAKLRHPLQIRRLSQLKELLSELPDMQLKREVC